MIRYCEPCQAGGSEAVCWLCGQPYAGWLPQHFGRLTEAERVALTAVNGGRPIVPADDLLHLWDAEWAIPVGVV